VNVDVTGLKTLQLTTRVNRGRDTRNTIFWGNPVILTADGKKIPLSQLKLSSQNAVTVASAGKDYAGGPVRIAGNPAAQSVAAEPQDAGQPAVVTVDLSGANAVRFKATVGGDWPVGDEEQLRKTCSVRSHGNEAQFLTLIEPYENKPMVKSAVALSADKLRVELADGRVQEITILNFAGDGQNISANITESRDGSVLRSETTQLKRGN
jgi:hypothetical protein